MKNLLFIFCFSLLFLFSIKTSFGCTLAVQALKDFDSTEYIFIGKVVGYTETLELPKSQEQTSGLIVEVLEKVFIPKSPKTHFEVFSYGLGADCSTRGVEKTNLQKDFPINSEIRVIAKEAEIFPSNLPDGNIRLEERPGELSSVALNIDGKGERMSSSTSFFNYKSFNYNINKHYGSNYFLPNFEVRKDLLRLKAAANQKGKNIILDRLFLAPVYTDLDFYSLFKEHTSSEAEFKRYYENHLKTTSPETFEHYKIYHDTLWRLVKLGYKQDTAERALSKTLEETEISEKKLFEKSLQILRKLKRTNK